MHTSRKQTHKYTRMYVNTFARVHVSSSTQARPHARAHTHTHTDLPDRSYSPSLAHQRTYTKTGVLQQLPTDFWRFAAAAAGQGGG